MAYKHDDKSSGQLIRSADWNAMGHEIERLETDKLNRSGDTIKGDLTVSGKARFDSLTVTGEAGITGKVLGPLAVSGDFGVSGKAQFGSLTVASDADIAGKMQLGSLTVTGDAFFKGNLKVDGQVENIIKVATFTKVVQNAGADKPAAWSQAYEGFSQVYSVFAVLQGFSLWGNKDISFEHHGHAQGANNIPQHVFVKITNIDQTKAEGNAYCSESDINAEGDNSILFTLVVIGRGN